MITKRTIAIIGAPGKTGAAISKSLSKGSDKLLLIADDPGKLNLLAEELKRISPYVDLEIMGCAFDACWEADIIILAVPANVEKDIAEKIKDVATGKIVISIADAVEELKKILPHSKVIKACNTSYAPDLELPLIEGKTVDAFIAAYN